MLLIWPTADDEKMIALLGRWFERLAQRVGPAAAGALVLAVTGIIWLVLAWTLGEW